jgi:hypothetical protein
MQLYADYKLATEGLCTQPRPSLFEFEKSAKWKAWKEAGNQYLEELQVAQSSTKDSKDDLDDAFRLILSTKAMISYVKRVEEGQWGWEFVASEPTSTGDRDLDELQAYLGVDKEEVSAEELLERPYVPIEKDLEGLTLTAAGISTLSTPLESVFFLRSIVT